MKKKKGQGKDLSLMALLGGTIIIEEVLERDIKKFGNSAHIAVPSKHIGRKAKIIIQTSKPEMVKVEAEVLGMDYKKDLKKRGRKK